MGASVAYETYKGALSNFPQPSYPPEPETGEAKVITSEVTFCRFRPRFVSSDQKTVSKYKFFF